MPRARSRLIASPSPTPPSGDVSRRLTCTNGSNTASIWSAAMPTPVSVTRTVSMADASASPSFGDGAASEHVTEMRPPDGVNFVALPSRFTTIWRSFAASARTTSGAAQVSKMYSSPFASICGATNDRTLATTSTSGRLSVLYATRPAASCP